MSPDSIQSGQNPVHAVAAIFPFRRYGVLIVSMWSLSEQSQWNPKYGCRGTVTARFALIAFVAWKRLADSTLGKLLVHPEYG